MSLIRWEPFSGIDEFLNRMPGALGRWPRTFEANGNTLFDWSPSVEISENDTEYLIRADLPAVRKEDVHVTLDDSMLTISGERKQRTEDKSEKSHRVETAYGKFSRSFSLPTNLEIVAWSGRQAWSLASAGAPCTMLLKSRNGFAPKPSRCTAAA